MSNEFYKWVFENQKIIRKLADIKNEETIKIKWKGATMNNYRRNWQYCITKEVLGIHEIIDPYDWKLDLEMNADFKLWDLEMQNKGDQCE